MSPQLAKKLLIVAVGVLFLLLAALFQLESQTQTPKSKDQKSEKVDLAPLLRSSILQQRRNFQRCWLQSTSGSGQQIWQLYLTVQSTGQVKHFELLNKALFTDETEKCLREISMRLKFPAFEGPDISFTIPITISLLNENR